MVTDGHVSLRTSAYVELHTWLAAAAKNDEEVGPELDPAKQAYKRSLQDDDEDALLDLTTRALASCSDDRCAIAAVAGAGFGYAYERALPIFIAKHWLRRATAAWAGIEAFHAGLGGDDGFLGGPGEALFVRAASELGVVWPDRPIPVDVVAEAPPASRAALLPVALATHGTCFFRRSGIAKGAAAPQQNVALTLARVLDCVAVRALLDPSATSPLRTLLGRELGPKDGERAYALVVVHAVAAIVTAWESKHVSAYRRSAEAVEPDMLVWLGREWRGSSAESHDAFGARVIARWMEIHAKPAGPSK